MIEKVGDYYLGQEISTAKDLKEYSQEEYALADLLGMRAFPLGEHRIFNGDGIVFGSVLWDFVIVGATKGKVYKIGLELYSKNEKLIDAAFKSFFRFIVKEMGRHSEHRFFSHKYIWDRPEGNVIFQNINDWRTNKFGMYAINVFFTASFIWNHKNTKATEIK